MWRQGDVLIQQVEALPQGTALLKRLELASGDTSGHAHKIKDRRRARLHASNWPNTGLFLEILVDDTQIVHPEHGAIALAAGVYRVWKQREFTDQGVRSVID